MRAFMCAVIATVGISFLFDYGLDRIGYSSADQGASSSVRLDD